jgi:Sec-independent protein translocase protein TatA
VFNINPGEMLVLAILFLVVFGPERLPDIAIQLGRTYRDIRRSIEQASGELTREFETAARIAREEEVRAKAELRAAAEAASGPAGGAPPPAPAEVVPADPAGEADDSAGRTIAPPDAGEPAPPAAPAPTDDDTSPAPAREP